MTNQDAPTYQQFLDAARATGDRKAYDDCLSALIRAEGPRLGSRGSDAEEILARCSAAARLAWADWYVKAWETAKATQFERLALTDL
jgi:hypothetical protein